MRKSSIKTGTRKVTGSKSKTAVKKRASIKAGVSKSAKRKPADAKKAGRAGASSNAKPQKAGTGNRRDYSGMEEGTALRSLFIDQLKDMYWAEKSLVKALSKMSKESTSSKLKHLFDDHLKVTEGHVSSVEKSFEILGVKASAKKCEAMEGLIEEAKELIKSTKKGTATRDVALIMAAQKVEHYEIASYGTLVSLAETLQLVQVRDVMKGILDEEKEADAVLSSIAESQINEKASEEEDGGKDSGESLGTYFADMYYK